MHKEFKQKSLLYRTNQSWKLYVMYCSAIIGIIVASTGLYWEISGQQQGNFLIYIGGIIGGVGGLFPCLFIRCPKCGTRWYWKFFTNDLSGDWHEKLYSQTTCSDCGYS